MKIKDILLEYKKDRKAPKFNIKPRTGHAPTQTGAGEHRDKKKEQKQGYEKHKGKGVAEMDTYPHPDSKEGKRLTKAIRDPNAPEVKPQPVKKTVKHATKILDKAFQKSVKEGVAEGESALEKFRKAADEREKKHNEIEAKRQAAAKQGKTDVKGAIDRLEKHLSNK